MSKELEVWDVEGCTCASTLRLQPPQVRAAAHLVCPLLPLCFVAVPPPHIWASLITFLPVP